MSRWYVLCDVCGRKVYNTETLKRWDGMRVCLNDYERKHPMLDYRYKVKNGEGQIPYGEPHTGHEDLSVSALVCDVYTSMGVASYGTAGCARVGTYNMALSPLPSLIVVPITENRIIP